jgi:homoserine/homoserine lactone efflux protein
MNFELLAAYAAVTLALCATPGPAVLFVVGQGVWRGPGAALRANAAINIVNTVNIGLVGLGLAAIVNLSHGVFLTLKFIGAAYLVWLGIKAIRSSFRPERVAETDRDGRPFLDGVIVQASNPKAYLFMGAIVPQFIDPAAAVAPQLAAMAVINLVIEFAVLGVYGLVAGSIRRSARRPVVRHWLERAGGGMLIAVGAVTALYRRT